MAILPLLLLCLTFSLSLALQNYCNPSFKPKPGTAFELDLSKLNQDIRIEENSATHPGKTSLRTFINICQGLSNLGDGKEGSDKCQQGAYVCRQKVYIKDNVEYIAVVQNIAGEFQGSTFKPEFKLVGTEEDLTKNGVQYSLTLNGGQELGQAQSASITLECDQTQDRSAANPSQPIPVSYQNNVLSVTWRTVHACAFKPGEKRPDQGNGGDTSTSSMGALPKIFLILVSAYIIGGALYNFKKYNARGLDLIPHRDFWMDLPYFVRDVISNCIDSVMSRRRGTSGYVAV